MVSFIDLFRSSSGPILVTTRNQSTRLDSDACGGGVAPLGVLPPWLPREPRLPREPAAGPLRASPRGALLYREIFMYLACSIGFAVLYARVNLPLQNLLWLHML